MILWIVLSIVVIMTIVGIVFVNQPSFGRIPRGERLARIERSPNYRDGAFRNIHETPLMTSDKGVCRDYWASFLRIRPDCNRTRR